MENKPAQKQDFTPSKVATKTMELYAQEYGLIPSIHFVFLGGNPYITSDGLLWLGNNHPDPSKQVAGISTQIIQADFEKNQFIVKATVILENGKQYEGIGTATKENLTRITANHGLEMAETRAVSRALRKAYAIGIPAIEELKEGQLEQKAPADKTKLSPEGIITENQRKRLFAIANKEGVSHEEVKLIIKEFGYESTKDIKVKHYNEIIQRIEEYAKQSKEIEETPDT